MSHCRELERTFFSRAASALTTRLRIYLKNAALYPDAGGTVTATRHRTESGVIWTADHFYGEGGWQSEPILSEREARVCAALLAKICGAELCT